MDPLYLIFSHRGPHSVVYLSRAASTLAAVREYVCALGGPYVFHPDGSLTCGRGREAARYPHVLALVEEADKTAGEWQIRRLPEGAEHAGLTEAFCSEDEWSVQQHLKECRPRLSKLHPRVRASGFVWYLRDGVMVVFYRRAQRARFEILARFVRRWDWIRGDYRPWSGTYDELADDLYLGPGPCAILSSPPAAQNET